MRFVKRSRKNPAPDSTPSEYDRTSAPAFGYCRGSTAEQVDTLEAQDVLIREYSLKNSLNLQQMIKESCSASVHFASRPLGAKLVETCKETRGHIIVTKADRLIRSLLDLLQLREWAVKQGITFHMINEGLKVGYAETSMDKVICNIMTSIAEMELARTRERILDVNRYKRSIGKPTTGNPPLGFTNSEGEVVVDWKEFRLLLWVLQARLNNGGYWDCARVANLLNASGYTTRSGRAWTAGAVATLVHRNPVHLKEKQARRQGVEVSQLLRQLEDNFPDTVDELRGYIDYARMPT